MTAVGEEGRSRMSSRSHGAPASWDDLSRYADHHQRGELLLTHAEAMSDGDYWRAVADAWQDSERQSLSRADWRRLWLADRPGREQAMTADEHAALAALPRRVAVFRGVHLFNGVAGLSWTFDREKAAWFARRDLDGYGAVVSGRVLHRRILALFEARQEHELIVQPCHVYARKWEAI